MPSELKIINRSGWPDWFLNPVCKWIVKRAGIEHKYSIVLRGIREQCLRSGRGGYWSQQIKIHRRYRSRPKGWAGEPPFPYLETYHRYKWASKFQINNRLEALVHLIAHEACHAKAGHPDNFYDRATRRIDQARMEMTCERFAHETVEEFRKLWPDMKRKLMDKIRAERQRRRSERMKIAPSAFAVHCMKRDKAQAALERWERKAKIAATYIKKYRRRLNYYQGRMAANTGN